MDYFEYTEILRDSANWEIIMEAEFSGGIIRSTPLSPEIDPFQGIKIVRLPVKTQLWAIVCDDCRQVFGETEIRSYLNEMYESHCDFHGVDPKPYENGFGRG